MCSVSRNRRRRLAVVATVAAVAAACVLSPAAALANTYNGLLYPGVTAAAASSNAYAANSVVTQQSWTAPSGAQFDGFAYTSATFAASNEVATGGLSSGFKGSGGNAPTDLNFPWTVDCSISEATPRVWIVTGVQVAYDNYGPAGVAPGSCNTVGKTSGWDYANAEVESTNTGIDPYSDYQTLTLSIWCARDANCSAGDAANYSVTNLSGHFDDSYGQPAGSASWSAAINGSDWYQTNSGSLGLSYSAMTRPGCARSTCR